MSSPDEPYEVLVDRRIEKDLRKAPPHIVEAFVASLDELARDPIRRRPGFDVKPLQGHDGVFRLRLGGWRVLYAVDRDARLVRVTVAARRSSAYK